MNDRETTVQELKDALEKFRSDRAWGKHNTPKNLATSISIEAAELLEHYQWDEYSKENDEEIENELADIINYCLLFALEKDIDISSAVEKKLALITLKYPTDIFNGQNDNQDDYHRIKNEYRKKKRE